VRSVEQKYSGLITWIIGGPNVIEQTLGVIDEFYISRIPGTFECDAHLPIKKIESLFEKTWSKAHEDVTFEIWKKRKVD
jgi:dihydrofolate reductase